LSHVSIMAQDRTCRPGRIDDGSGDSLPARTTLEARFCRQR
jgi:hypothetical protein